MSKHVLGNSKNKHEVYVNLTDSSAGRNLNRQPYLIKHVQDCIASHALRGATTSISIDVGKVIGNTEIVETTEKDLVFYAQPHKREVFFRYVKNRSSVPSSALTLLLDKADDGYELTHVWIGEFCPPFPGDANEVEESKRFWDSHALVIDPYTSRIQSKTITPVCPY